MAPLVRDRNPFVFSQALPEEPSPWQAPAAPSDAPPAAPRPKVPLEAPRVFMEADELGQLRQGLERGDRSAAVRVLSYGEVRVRLWGAADDLEDWSGLHRQALLLLQQDPEYQRQQEDLQQRMLSAQLAIR